MRFVLATANPHKVDEIRAILGDGVQLLPRPLDLADVAETADTLEGNARLKANAVVQATGVAVIADDTGLEVDALLGAPGVHSARYAGAAASDADNVRMLLSRLVDEPSPRRARFRTVALAVFPDGREIMAHGVCSGSIGQETRGRGGFGYDPVFVPDEADGLTFAELNATLKNDISHRGRAFRRLACLLRDSPTA